MAYPNVQYYESTNPPSLATAAYNSSHPNQVLYDEHEQPYINVAGKQGVVWRQYISQTGPAVYNHLATDYPQRQVLQPQYAYPNPQLLGAPALTLGSDHTSGRPTPRSTPEPNTGYRRPAVAPKRKAEKRSREKAKRPALEKPLSELTKGYKDIPVRDTEAFVNRPIEERRAEKRPDGSIKRPSNSFMLYRSAYTERCREFEKSKNHQDISSIAGASWAIETPKIKAQFEEWAKVERENHQKAFPSYKFQPQTQAAKDRKRKRAIDEQSDDLTDHDDPTYHQGRGGPAAARRSTRVAKHARNTYREYSDSPTLPSQDEANTPEPYALAQNTSYFGGGVVNTSKPAPYAFDRSGQPLAYYPVDNQGPDYGGYEFPTNAEELQFFGLPNEDFGATAPPPMGLPGASHNDLMGDMALDGGQLMLGGPAMVDPELLGHDQNAPVHVAIPGSAKFAEFNPNEYLWDDRGTPDDAV